MFNEIFMYILASHLVLADDLYIKLLFAHSKTSLYGTFYLST
jgi:hypothetical protein